MKHNIIIFCLLWLLVAVACKPQNQETKVDRDELMVVDREFSAFSKQNGYHSAFLEFADSGAVLLRPGSMPYEGRSSLQKLFAGRSDSSITLIWVPEFAAISGSGDLGYTYGTYTARLKNDTIKGESKGTYVTIWKKQADGKWKYVLDTGNEGLGDEPEK